MKVLGADCIGKWLETWFWFQIVKEAYPDHTQFEKSSPYYDPSSKEDNPKWSMVKTTTFPVSWGEGWTKGGRERPGESLGQVAEPSSYSYEVTLTLELEQNVGSPAHRNILQAAKTMDWVRLDLLSCPIHLSYRWMCSLFGWWNVSFPWRSWKPITKLTKPLVAL